MRVEIAFGAGFDRAGQPLDAEFVRAALKSVLVETAREFGGCTVLDGQGAWINAAGDLALEACKVLVVNLPPGESRMGADLDARIDALAEFVRGAFHQESVNVSKVVATSSFVSVLSR